jgi:hypothetical protein
LECTGGRLTSTRDGYASSECWSKSAADHSEAVSQEPGRSPNLPLPAALVELLTEHQEEYPSPELVFTTSAGGGR